MQVTLTVVHAVHMPISRWILATCEYDTADANECHYHVCR